MTNNLHSLPPLALQGPVPSWADPPVQDGREIAPSNEEVRAYLIECFFLLPHRVIYCPSHGCVVGMRGYMNVPDSYAEYPMLAIYFRKFRLRKYPIDVLRNDITWPAPCVVLNTIMRRLRSHRFLKSNRNAATIPDDIRKAISPNLEIPSGKEGEILEVPYSERKSGANQVVKEFEGDAKEEVEDFFDELLSASHAELCLNRTVIRVTSDYSTAVSS